MIDSTGSVVTTAPRSEFPRVATPYFVRAPSTHVLLPSRVSHCTVDLYVNIVLPIKNRNNSHLANEIPLIEIVYCRLVVPTVPH